MGSAIMPELGREVTVEACGRTWRVGRLTIDVVERFLDWLRPHFADPLEGLEKIIPLLPIEEAKALIREAREEKRALLDFDSPPVVKALMTKRGRVHLFHAMMQTHQPTATLADAIAIVEEIGGEKLAQVIAAANGNVPGKAEAPAPEAGLTGAPSESD